MMNTLLRAAVAVFLLTTVQGGAYAAGFSLRDEASKAGGTMDVQSRLSHSSLDENSPPSGEGNVSATKAVLYSILLPGLGHYYAGDRGTATAFFIAEAAIWTSFLVFRVQGYQREQGYEDFAQVFAGASTGHSDDFYQIIAEFNSSSDYEASVKGEGRLLLYPDVNTEALERYYLEHRVGDFEAWQWGSDDERRSFRARRSSSKEAYRRSTYAAAAALANRAISAFLSIRSAKDANHRSASQSFRIEVDAPDFRRGGDLRTGVSLVREF